MSWKVFLQELFGKLWIMLRFFLLIGLAFVLLYPLLFMLSTAFKPLEQVTDPSVIWIPRSFTMDNFKLAFEAMDYPQALGNTLLIGGISSLLQVASCALVGYGLARFRFRGRSLIFAMAIFTIIVPPQTIAVPLFGMYRNFSIPFIGQWLSNVTGYDLSVSLLNNPVLFYIPAALGMGIRAGLYIFVFRQFFRGIPVELEEAATVDGCGTFKTFLFIMVPNAAVAFLTVFLFSIVWYWNDYFNTSMFLSDRNTLATALSLLRQNLGLMGISTMDPFLLTTRLQAGSLLLLTPLLIMYLFLQRYFIQGVERSGIVG